MSFPKVLEQVWHMSNSGLNEVGEHLGYDWNQVCDEVREAEFYAQDGDGIFTVHRCSKGDYSSSEVINKIINAIFFNYPQAESISISN